MHTRRTLSRYGGGVYDIYSCRPHCVENTSPVPFQPPPSRRRLHPRGMFRCLRWQWVYSGYNPTGDYYTWMKRHGSRFRRRTFLRPSLAGLNRGGGLHRWATVGNTRTSASPGGRRGSPCLHRDLQQASGSVACSARCT